MYNYCSFLLCDRKEHSKTYNIFYSNNNIIYIAIDEGSTKMPFTLEEFQASYFTQNNQQNLISWIDTREEKASKDAFQTFFNHLLIEEKIDFITGAWALSTPDFNALASLAGLKDIDRDVLMNRATKISHLPQLIDLVPDDFQNQVLVTAAHYFLAELFVQRFHLIDLNIDDEAIYPNIADDFLTAFIVLCYPVRAFYSIEKTSVNDNSLYDALDRKKLFGFDLKENIKTYKSEFLAQACKDVGVHEGSTAQKKKALQIFIDDMSQGNTSPEMTLHFLSSALSRPLYILDKEGHLKKADPHNSVFPPVFLYFNKGKYYPLERLRHQRDKHSDDYIVNYLTSYQDYVSPIHAYLSARLDEKEKNEIERKRYWLSKRLYDRGGEHELIESLGLSGSVPCEIKPEEMAEEMDKILKYSMEHLDSDLLRLLLYKKPGQIKFSSLEQKKDFQAHEAARQFLNGCKEKEWFADIRRDYVELLLEFLKAWQESNSKSKEEIKLTEFECNIRLDEEKVAYDNGQMLFDVSIKEATVTWTGYEKIIDSALVSTKKEIKKYFGSHLYHNESSKENEQYEDYCQKMHGSLVNLHQQIEEQFVNNPELTPEGVVQRMTDLLKEKKIACAEADTERSAAFLQYQKIDGKVNNRLKEPKKIILFNYMNKANITPASRHKTQCTSDYSYKQSFLNAFNGQSYVINWEAREFPLHLSNGRLYHLTALEWFILAHFDGRAPVDCPFGMFDDSIAAGLTEQIEEKRETRAPFSKQKLREFSLLLIGAGANLRSMVNNLSSAQQGISLRSSERPKPRQFLQRTLPALPFSDSVRKEIQNISQEAPEGFMDCQYNLKVFSFELLLIATLSGSHEYQPLSLLLETNDMQLIDNVLMSFCIGMKPDENLMTRNLERKELVTPEEEEEARQEALRDKHFIGLTPLEMNRVDEEANGWTLLHKAIAVGYFPLCYKLLNAKASLTVKDSYGNTPGAMLARLLHKYKETEGLHLWKSNFTSLRSKYAPDLEVVEYKVELMPDLSKRKKNNLPSNVLFIEQEGKKLSCRVVKYCKTGFEKSEKLLDIDIGTECLTEEVLEKYKADILKEALKKKSIRDVCPFLSPREMRSGVLYLRLSTGLGVWEYALRKDRKTMVKGKIRAADLPEGFFKQVTDNTLSISNCKNAILQVTAANGHTLSAELCFAQELVNLFNYMAQCACAMDESSKDSMKSGYLKNVETKLTPIMDKRAIETRAYREKRAELRREIRDLKKFSSSPWLLRALRHALGYKTPEKIEKIKQQAKENFQNAQAEHESWYLPLHKASQLAWLSFEDMYLIEQCFKAIDKQLSNPVTAPTLFLDDLKTNTVSAFNEPGFSQGYVADKLNEAWASKEKAEERAKVLQSEKDAADARAKALQSEKDAIDARAKVLQSEKDATEEENKALRAQIAEFLRTQKMPEEQQQESPSIIIEEQVEEIVAIEDQVEEVVVIEELKQKRKSGSGPEFFAHFSRDANTSCKPVQMKERKMLEKEESSDESDDNEGRPPVYEEKHATASP